MRRERRGALGTALREGEAVGGTAQGGEICEGKAVGGVCFGELIQVCALIISLKSNLIKCENLGY
jgi:hypothetical protein